MMPSTPSPASYEDWLDETFGRAVAGEWYPAFIGREADEEPAPVPDQLALEYLTNLFERPQASLRFYSDRQIAAGLWGLGPGDIHCVYNRALSVDARERLIASVASFFRDFFDPRCLPKLSHAETGHVSPLNTICYMWWEVIHMGAAGDDPAAERLNGRAMDVMEAVLWLPNPACKEAALHGLGHIIHRSDHACAIIDHYLAEAVLTPDLASYARSARSGCIQ